MTAARELRASARRTVPLRVRRIVGRLVPGDRMEPGFVVGGVKRAGTTSLYEYLRVHPDFIPPVVTKGSRYFDVNHDRGPAWYRSHFPHARRARRHEQRTGYRPVTGESSPYLVFHPLGAERLAAAHPDIRCIVLLRDPVQRAWSHYRYECQRGFEELPVHEALDAEADRLAGEAERMVADPTYVSFAHRHWSYLARGHYAEQLETLWSAIPRAQTLVLRSEDLFETPGDTFRRVTDFLGLRRFEPVSYEAWKAAAYAPIPDDVRARLTGYFRSYDEDLTSLLGTSGRWNRGPQPPPATAGGASRPS